MFDSGALGFGYVDRSFVVENGLKVMKIDRPIKVKTVDGAACGTG